MVADSRAIRPVGIAARIQTHSLAKMSWLIQTAHSPKTDSADLANGSDEFWANERLRVRCSSRYRANTGPVELIGSRCGWNNARESRDVLDVAVLMDGLAVFIGG